MAGTASGNDRLERKLQLFDVYAIATGAMFSSGFFLLPGLDRSMGALVGTVGGLGTWVALVLESAFALIGMGAYLALFFDLPIKPLAIALTAVFAAVNLLGAKESSGLQRVLVIVLLGVLAYFLDAGALHPLAAPDAGAVLSSMSPWLTHGAGGLAYTVGFVFVSYAGLTKASRPSRAPATPGSSPPPATRSPWPGIASCPGSSPESAAPARPPWASSPARA